MLGYTEADIKKMMACSSLAIGKFNDEDIDKGFIMTIDFFQGLLEEGKV